MPIYEDPYFRFLEPFERALRGERFEDPDIEWVDEETLDPWADWREARLQAKVRRDIGGDPFARKERRVEPPLQEIVLPPATGGDAIADRRAAARGVDPSDGKGAASVIDLARSQIGTPYVWGGEAPGEAFDCSGFTQWLVKRATGKQLTHMASAQQNELPKIGRDELKVGDLVFFNYGRKGAGIADHVGVYIGNGMMIDASSNEGKVTQRPVDWDNFLHGGDVGATSVKKSGAKKKARPVVQAEPPTPTMAPAELARDGGVQLTSVLAAMFGEEPAVEGRQKRVTGKGTPKFRGENAWIKRQLYQGFIDSGRPDLAAMVGTKAFDTWIRAESGWRPDVVSQFYPGHGRNAGLFQFALLDRDWVWSGVSRDPWRYNVSPYEQAQLVVQYFGHLTPARIRDYAAQIRAGTYRGWG